MFLLSSVERRGLYWVQVWVIPETNEVFTSYEAYLNRRDFYQQRRFICEITGHSGLTFYEALQSEVRNIIPKHFSRVPR